MSNTAADPVSAQYIAAQVKKEMQPLYDAFRAGEPQAPEPTDAQLLATADSHGYEADPETDAKMVKLLRAVYFQGLAAVQRESARSDGPDDGEVKR